MNFIYLLSDLFKPWSNFKASSTKKKKKKKSSEKERERMRLGRRFGADLEEGGWRWFRENGTPTMAITAIATSTALRLRPLRRPLSLRL